jgi:hypothetical protein
MKLPRTVVDRLVENVGLAPLGNEARTKRARKVMAGIAQRPSASMPEALGGDAAIEAGYRFVNNPKVTFPNLMAGIVEATRREAAKRDEVLVVHDTTTCCFPHLPPEELGWLNTGKTGFYLHLSLVLDGHEWRRPLGVIHAETVHRRQRSKRRGQRKASGTDTARQPEREFERWLRGVEAAADRLKDCGRVIHLADREGDSFELMALLQSLLQGFVIRVRVDRRAQEAEDKDATWSTVRQVAGRCEGVLERDVPLTRRPTKGTPVMNKVHPPRKQRLARLTFSATRVVIPRPQYLRDPFPVALDLNLVHVIEKDPPPGEAPVEWLLYTTEPIDTAAQVAKVVDHYRARWTIEEFNAALKTGCVYETRAFETRHALLNVLALSLPIACAMLWLRSRARTDPTAPASDVLTPLQIRILRRFGTRKVSAHPTAQEALFAVAGLGGHWRGNGEPGWKVLQRGLVLLGAYEAGFVAGEEATRRGKK